MLALITGNGALPAAVARAQELPPVVCALDGHAPDDLVPDMSFRIEQLGSALVQLRERGVTDVCFCGAITRPQIDPTLIDAETMPLVPVLAGAVAGGEDSALRAVLGIFESSGFAAHGAHELAPELLPARGALTNAGIPQSVAQDIAQARAILVQQGEADLGQACVVRGGVVIAQEDARGTDAMLGDLVPTPKTVAGADPVSLAMDLVTDALDGAADWLSGPVAEQRALAKGGFLFKAPKPQQDRRVDLPAIGPQTAMRAAEAGLDGIVIEAGGVMVLDASDVVDILNSMGMFCWVR